MTVSTLEIGLEEARFKAAETVATGLRTLEFYAAAFSATPDKNGDIIDPHAFDGWLKRFYAEGKALPISFNHAAVLDGLDPTNVVGYAPADPEHVWVDDYGLRVKGFLDTGSEKGKAVEWQIENGLLSGASLAFEVPETGLKKKDDHTLITDVTVVRETGPVPNPANQSAVLLWLKSEGLLEEDAELPYMTVAEFREVMAKAVDGSAWDGNKAMGMCSSAADYHSICAAEHTIGTPDERQHWAFPHHFPGKGPNAAGVRAGLSRVSQAQNMTDAQRTHGQNHLEAHMGDISPDRQASAETEEVITATEDTEDTILAHRSAASSLQSAHDALVRAGAKCASVGEPAAKSLDSYVEEVKRTVAEELTSDRTAVINRELRAIEVSLA